MRLSPKSIFFAIVALGLPFAVTVGWSLGAPTRSLPPATAAPAGAGGLGTAPATSTGEPDTPVDYGSRPPRPTSTATPATSAPIVPGASATSGLPGLPLPTLSGLPPLTDPPVPTPTNPTSAPPSPSPTPSASASEAPTAFGLLR